MLSYERTNNLMSLLTVSFEHIQLLWEHPGGHNTCWIQLSITSHNLKGKILQPTIMCGENHYIIIKVHLFSFKSYN